MFYLYLYIPLKYTVWGVSNNHSVHLPVFSPSFFLILFISVSFSAYAASTVLYVVSQPSTSCQGPLRKLYMWHAPTFSVVHALYFSLSLAFSLRPTQHTFSLLYINWISIPPKSLSLPPPLWTVKPRAPDAAVFPYLLNDPRIRDWRDRMCARAWQDERHLLWLQHIDFGSNSLNESPVCPL